MIRRCAMPWAPVLLILCGCGGPPLLDVTVSGTAGLTYLRAAVSLGGTPGTPVQQFTDTGGEFGLELPPDAQGLVQVDLEGYSSPSCVSARGHGQVMAPLTARTPLGVALNTLPTAVCQCANTTPVFCLEATPRLLINAIWGSGPEQFWLVGDSDQVMFNGSQGLISRDTGAGADWKGVWGSDMATVWVVGSGAAIQRWDGKAWHAEAAPQGVTATLFAIHGSVGSGAGKSATVWVVGDSGTVLRRDPAGFVRVPSGVTTALRGVFVIAPDDVWLAGDGGTLLRWQGSTLTPLNSHTTKNLRAVWAGATNDVWIVGDGGTVLHWNGALNTTDGPTVSNDLYGVWGSTPPGAGESGGPPEIWTVGDRTTVAHRVGTTWTVAASGLALGVEALLTAVWGSSPYQVFIAGPNALVRRRL